MDASSPMLKEDCIKIALENLADNGDIDPEEATEGTYTFVVLPGHVEEL